MIEISCRSLLSRWAPASCFLPLLLFALSVVVVVIGGSGIRDFCSVFTCVVLLISHCLSFCLHLCCQDHISIIGTSTEHNLFRFCPVSVANGLFVCAHQVSATCLVEAHWLIAHGLL